jgi:predicted peptidase
MRAIFNFILAIGFSFLTPSIFFCQASKLDKVIDSKNLNSVYPYWCYEPTNYNLDTSYNWPIIIFLHGRSLSGTNLERLKRYGVIAEIEKGRSFPAIIIAPQVSNGLSWDPIKIMNCIESVKKTHRIDTTKISITGMSLGAYGVISTIAKFPHSFSAAASFCGGGDIKLAKNLTETPLWIAHGESDLLVPFSQSLQLVEAIAKQGSQNYIFTAYENYGHGSLERIFRTDFLYDFLLSNTLGTKPYLPDILFNKLNIDIYMNNQIKDIELLSE